ncbi:hypothetical protein PWG14_14315 (plasmid) [Chromobacterium amazonense]|uniref:hypothetical protein n=1 Tax=Chromobacterium amazonense TaxID=1382803 RepID=UPI00237E8D77|nr:hypothetical protein [Chromobacterium amazonense]MDE1713736.1 hypothetical protein [Chromobacterium amazonense]
MRWHLLLLAAALSPLAACSQLQQTASDLGATAQVNLSASSDQTYLLHGQGSTSLAVTRAVSKKANQVCMNLGMKVGQMTRADPDGEAEDSSLQPRQLNGQYQLAVRFSCQPY